MSLTLLCSSVYIRYKKAYYLLPKTTYDILKHLVKLLWMNMLWNGELWEVGSWFSSKQTICAAKNSLIFLCIILILTSDNTADNNTKVFPKKFNQPPKQIHDFTLQNNKSVNSSYSSYLQIYNKVCKWYLLILALYWIVAQMPLSLSFSL